MNKIKESALYFIGLILFVAFTACLVKFVFSIVAEGFAHILFKI